MGRKLSSSDASEWTERGLGRVRYDGRGHATFVIRRMINGKRYDISTRAHSLSAALEQNRRFEENPEKYDARGDVDDEPLYLDLALSKEFLKWSRDERGNSAGWLAKQKTYLSWWMERLNGVNLRRASLRDHILPALDGVTARGHRIEIIKSFFGWLRKHKHAITASEDPTLDTLTVPQAKPAQRTKSKVIPRDHYLLVVEKLREPPESKDGIVSLQDKRDAQVRQQWADLLVVLAGTGWHVTELRRFAETGRIEPLPKAMRVENGAVAVLVCPMHKSGDVHRTAVSAEVLEAAKRVRVRGWPADSVFPFYAAVSAACASVKRPDGGIGIPPFGPGQFRHSVATWAVEAGADLAAVAAFLGHKSASTTRRFYATLAVVPKVPTLA